MILSLVMAVLCIGYGVLLFSQNYGTSFFMVWLALGGFFVILAFAIKKELWKKLPKLFRRVITVLICVGMCFFICVEGLIATKLGSEGEANLDYIIVLGALVREEGPSTILKERLDAAIDYLEENPDTLCIVSGGQGFNEPYSEAFGMKKYLVEKGVDESRIILEDESLNTIQNIQNSMKLMDDKDSAVGVVTSNFHVYRAIGIAKKQGLTNVSGIAGDVIPLYLPTNMFREFFGVVKDKIKGNM